MREAQEAWTIITGYLYDTTLDDAITTTLQGNISIESLMSSNRYSRKFIEGSTAKKSIKKLAARLYETSPRY
jgi:hypothetical protein